ANGVMTVEAILSHVGGHIEYSGPMPCPRDETGAKNAIQGMGSAATYGERYTTIAILHITTTEDDDGVLAGPMPGEDPELPDDFMEGARNAAGCGTATYENWCRTHSDKQLVMMLVKSLAHMELKQVARDEDERAEREDAKPE
ncbi:MAG: ERF family protein, partial [Alphaproteobacteria bacterium]|nr:ERF family protein [Alphaproteobacteria bacterium]